MGRGGWGTPGFLAKNRRNKEQETGGQPRENECAGWRVDGDHLGLVVPLLLLCALGNQLSAKKPYKDGAILKEMRRVRAFFRVPVGLRAWFPTHFTKNVKWVGTKVSCTICENALDRMDEEVDSASRFSNAIAQIWRAKRAFCRLAAFCSRAFGPTARTRVLH